MHTKTVLKTANYLSQSKGRRPLDQSYPNVFLSRAILLYDPLKGKLSYKNEVGQQWINSLKNCFLYCRTSERHYLCYCAVWIPKKCFLNTQFMGGFCIHIGKYCSIRAVSFLLFWLQTSVLISNSKICFSARRNFSFRNSRNWRKEN